MEFKGTKGEWYVGDDCDIISKLVGERIRNHKDPLVSQKDNGEIAQCWQDYYDGTIIPTEEAKANAQLIATAPELLEMLKIYLYDLNNNMPSSHAQRCRVIDVEELIEKATKID
jgi:hypothetical protein